MKRLFNDIKDNRVAILAILLYFLIAKFILHTICPMVWLTGLPCPACGMTRAGVALLTGQFAKAWQIHPFIYVFVVVFALWFVSRYVLQKSVSWMRPLVIICLILLIAFYVYRMIRFFPGEPPMSYYSGNVLLRCYQLLTGRLG